VDTIPEDLSAEVMRAASWVKRLRRGGNPENLPLEAMVTLVITFLKHYFGEAPSWFVAPAEARFPSLFKEAFAFRLRLGKPPKPSQKGFYLFGFSEEVGQVVLIVKEEWGALVSQLRVGDVLSCIGVKKGDKEPYYFLGYPGWLVLEPDFLLEINALAECVEWRGEYPERFFLRQLLPQSTGKERLYGSLVSSLLSLDALGKRDFGELFAMVRKTRALSFAFLRCLSPQLSESQVAEALQEKYAGVSAHLRQKKYTVCLPEETLLSEEVGLIGQVDFMALREKAWHLLEVKTGKVPQREPWMNHQAQLLGYHFIAQRLGLQVEDSMTVFYAPQTGYPIVWKPEVVQRLVNLRNQVVLFHRHLQENPEGFLETLLAEKNAGALPAFLEEKFLEFQQAFRSLSVAERKYYAHFLAFVFREQGCNRTGVPGSPHFSALWRKNRQEKEEICSVLSDLVWVEEESDATEGIFAFRSTSEEQVSDFRAGDAVLLTPQNPTEPPFFLRGMLLSIDSHRVIIRAQSPHSFRYHLETHKTQPLTMEHALYDQYEDVARMLSRFLFADAKRRELLLGLRRPRFQNVHLPLPPELRPEQQEIIRRAFGAEDYFLIQGPPGSGKTKYILANLVKLFLTHTSEKLLLLAFTNRAVDEMCEALHGVLSPEQLLRLGTTQNPTATHYTPEVVLGGCAFDEIPERMAKIRVLASTLASALWQWDFLEYLKPTVAIVDEASQLLEPHLVGILSTVSRFILIGDEKQLPAVVLQHPEELEVRDEKLRELGISYFGMSLFERLLRNAQQKGWDCYRMLTAQGRMHNDIQDLANRLFYNGALCTITTRQSSPPLGYHRESADPVERILATSRVLFIPTPPEDASRRTHPLQVRVVVRFLETLERFREKITSIGVVTPFRAQVNALRKSLKEEWNPWVQVDTVERFQGAEKEVIFISLPVSSPRLLPFIQSFPPEPLVEEGILVDRKLNVALTRAREHLVILGVPHILSRSPVYRELLNCITQKGGYLKDREILETLGIPNLSD
jgi:DNA replication ATP-dependent helicase Dna2